MFVKFLFINLKHILKAPKELSSVKKERTHIELIEEKHVQSSFDIVQLLNPHCSNITRKGLHWWKKLYNIKLRYTAYILEVVQFSQFKSVNNFLKLFLFCGQIVALLPILGNNIFYYSLSWNNSEVSPNCHIACSKRLAQLKSLALTQVNPTTNSCVSVRILERSQ
jgi:hypothetical protein